MVYTSVLLITFIIVYLGFFLVVFYFIFFFFFFLNKQFFSYFSTKMYGKCPNNLNTKVSDKMTHANSAVPDQTAPGSTLFAIPLSILRNNCIKSKI